MPLWTSEAHPGSEHDITTAREQVLGIVQHYLAELPILSDCGYEGAGRGVHVPVKQPKDGTDLSDGVRTCNMLLYVESVLSSARGVVEEGVVSGGRSLTRVIAWSKSVRPSA